MISVNDFAVEQIKKVMQSKGYAFFTNGDYNLNIIGVRSSKREANSFDDWMVLCYKANNIWLTRIYHITTDAGTYWLKNPLDKRGTAILVPNQYRGVYSIDKHNGKYFALCQRKGKVKTYRDNDRDKILDMDASTITEGMYGINIHRSNPYTESISVDKWSAGCQVFANPKDFEQFMEICNKARNIWGNKFTYTLLLEEDFN
jgi:hypothetical protein